MCEPITLAGIALSIAGTVVNSIAASEVAEARASAMEAERQRQKGYQDEAAAVNAQSLKRYSNADADITAAAQKATDTVKTTQEHTADANTMAGSQMPTSSSDIVNSETTNQMAKSKAYTGQQAEALGTLRGFGDMLGEASRGQAQLRASEEQIKTLRETGAISELDSLRRLGEARQESANQLATLAEQARALADAAPGNEKLAEALRKIDEAARQAADGAQLLTQRAKELSDPEAGFAKGMRAVAEEAEQIGKQMEAATIRAFNGMTDALVGFVMTGKLDFRSLANSIISDLIRIQIQRAITLPLAKAMSSFFGFADGGVMTAEGPLPLRGYASGGIANSPQLAVFGEGSRPEAYVPLPDGRTIPVTMSGGAAGSMGAGHVFNISVNVSDAGAAARGDSAGGRDLGQAVANAVRQELLAQKRAGGLLDSRRAW
jgi:lambda family phage tail tape measure protein